MSTLRFDPIARPVAGLAAILALVIPMSVHAQRTSPRDSTSPAALRARARVTPDSARRIALARVPGGAVKSSELEMEKGHLVYSFDISVPKQAGIEEVQVDALSGVIVSVEHETPAAEAKERAQDARARRARPSAKPSTH